MSIASVADVPMTVVARKDFVSAAKLLGFGNLRIIMREILPSVAPLVITLFTLQVGFMSPSFVGIVPSIEMVIYTAVGGRLSIFGAVYGTLLVNFAKTSLSESFPELWLFGLGGLFGGFLGI